MEFVADPEGLLYRAGSIEFTPQPGLSDAEVTADLCDSEVEDFGGFLGGEAAEEGHFGWSALQGIGAGGLSESGNDGEKQGRAVRRREIDSRQRQFGGSATAFLSVASAGVIDQNLTHDVRSDPHEVSTTAKVRRTLADQTGVGLMDEGGGLQSVAGVL